MINPVMEIEEVTLENVVKVIEEFYDPYRWNFITINGTDIGGKIQLDWLFSKYFEKNQIKIFRAIVNYDDFIPSIVPVIPSAWLAEWELTDMFGLNVENSIPGMFIADDGPKAPLRQDTQL